jgi:hypothetical protein
LSGSARAAIELPLRQTDAATLVEPIARAADPIQVRDRPAAPQSVRDFVDATCSTAGTAFATGGHMIAAALIPLLFILALVALFTAAAGAMSWFPATAVLAPMTNTMRIDRAWWAEPIPGTRGCRSRHRSSRAGGDHA